MGWTLVKIISLSYLFGACSLSLASLAWWGLRKVLAPCARASAGMLALMLSTLASLVFSIAIALGVVTHHIRMTTPYFHGLMGGHGGAAITVSGWAVLLLSCWLAVVAYQQTRLPQGSKPYWRESGMLLCPNPAVATVSLVGVWRQQLWVNPGYWDSLGQAERAMVLRHEQLHFTRRDNLSKLALRFIASLYFVLPWIRRWPSVFELDSELAVDDACRRETAGAAYTVLVAGAIAVAAGRQRVVMSALNNAGMLERLRVLHEPRKKPQAWLALLAVVATTICASSLGVGILLHPVSRCFLACYLGF